MSDQYFTPGSQSLAPFTKKRPRDAGDSAETATSNSGFEDAERQKRANTLEVFGPGVYNYADTVDGFVHSDDPPWPAFSAQALDYDCGSSGITGTFGNRFWGSMSAEMQDDPFGLSSSCGTDQNNRWAGPSIPEIQDATTSLPSFLPTFAAAVPDLYTPGGLGYAVSEAQGQDALQAMYTGLADGQWGDGPVGLNLTMSHPVSDPAQDGIELLGLSSNSTPMIPEPMALDPVTKDESVATSSPPRLDTTVPLESPHLEDVGYDTCFGIVGAPSPLPRRMVPPTKT